MQILKLGDLLLQPSLRASHLLVIFTGPLSLNPDAHLRGCTLVLRMLILEFGMELPPMFVFSGISSTNTAKERIISYGESQLLQFVQFNHLQKLFALLLKKNNISCTSRRLAQSEDIRNTEVPDSFFLFTSSCSLKRIIANDKLRFMRIRRDESLPFGAQLFCSIC
jgi:hypothetical protein